MGIFEKKKYATVVRGLFRPEREANNDDVIRYVPLSASGLAIKSLTRLPHVFEFAHSPHTTSTGSRRHGIFHPPLFYPAVA